MKKLFSAALRVALLGAVGYAAFKTLLTPEAQENVVATVKRAAAAGEAVANSGGPTEAEKQAAADKVAANQRWVAEQWAKAGY